MDFSNLIIHEELVFICFYTLFISVWFYDLLKVIEVTILKIMKC